MYRRLLENPDFSFIMDLSGYFIFERRLAGNHRFHIHKHPASTNLWLDHRLAVPDLKRGRG
jgi:hypothetical protein